MSQGYRAENEIGQISIPIGINDLRKGMNHLLPEQKISTKTTDMPRL